MCLFVAIPSSIGDLTQPCRNGRNGRQALTRHKKSVKNIFEIDGILLANDFKTQPIYGGPKMQVQFRSLIIVSLALAFTLLPALLWAQAQRSKIDGVDKAPAELNGTWSGNWTPKGGIPEAMTVEIKQESDSRLTGKFVTPVKADFTNTSFNPKTHALLLEAVDEKSGKRYKVTGKIEGTELTGTLNAGNTTGDLRLIKWTFFGNTIRR